MVNASEDLAKYKNILANIGMRDLLGPGPELESLELKVLDFLFEEPSSPVMKDTHKQQLLFKHRDLELSRERLLTAGPNAWMEDTIIDAVGLMLTVMQRKYFGVLRSWYLPTWVQHLIGSGQDFETIWNKLAFYTGPLNECENIFFPVNEAGKHWYLVVVSPRQRATLYVDTWKDDSRLKHRMYVAQIVDQFVRCKKDLTKGNLGLWKRMDEDKDKRWFVAELVNTPDQRELNDGANCGAYVVHFMLHPKELANPTPRNIVTAKARMRLMASLILWEENSERQAILDYLNINPMITNET